MAAAICCFRASGISAARRTISVRVGRYTFVGVPVGAPARCRALAASNAIIDLIKTKKQLDAVDREIIKISSTPVFIMTPT